MQTKVRTKVDKEDSYVDIFQGLNDIIDVNMRKNLCNNQVKQAMTEFKR